MEEEKKEEEKREEEKQSEGKETEETPGVKQAKEAMGMVQGIIGNISNLIGGVFGGSGKEKKK